MNSRKAARLTPHININDANRKSDYKRLIRNSCKQQSGLLLLQTSLVNLLLGSHTDNGYPDEQTRYGIRVVIKASLLILGVVCGLKAVVPPLNIVFIV